MSPNIEELRNTVFGSELAKNGNINQQRYEKMQEKCRELFSRFISSNCPEERQFALEIVGRIWTTTKRRYVQNRIDCGSYEDLPLTTKNWWEGTSPLDPDIQDNCYNCNCAVPNQLTFQN